MNRLFSLIFSFVGILFYSEHSIVLDLMIQELNTNHRYQVNLTGNSFFVANNYKSDQAREAVVIKSDKYKNVTVQDLNFYQKIEDYPKYHNDIQLIK